MRVSHIALGSLLLVSVRDSLASRARGGDVVSAARKEAVLPRLLRLRRIQDTDNDESVESPESVESVSEESVSSVSEESVSSVESVSEESISEESVSSISDDEDEDEDATAAWDKLVGDIEGMKDELNELEDELLSDPDVVPDELNDFVDEVPVDNDAALPSIEVQGWPDSTTASPVTEATTAAPEASAATTPEVGKSAAEILSENGDMEVLMGLIQNLRDAMGIIGQGEGQTEGVVSSELKDAMEMFMNASKKARRKKVKKQKNWGQRRALQEGDGIIDDLAIPADEASTEEVVDFYEDSDKEPDVSSEEEDDFEGLPLSNEAIENGQDAIQNAEKHCSAALFQIEMYKSDVDNVGIDLKTLARRAAKTGMNYMKCMKKIDDAIAKVEYALGVRPAEAPAEGSARRRLRVLQKKPKEDRARGRGTPGAKLTKEERMAERAARKGAKAKARAERLEKLEKLKEELDGEEKGLGNLIDESKKEKYFEDLLPDFDDAQILATSILATIEALGEVDGMLQGALG